MLEWHRVDLRQTNRPIDVLLHWYNKSDGGLYLDAPYQRGEVWGRKRRVNYIRSLTMGIPVPSIIVNDRLAADWKDDYRIAVIDGKQRITTLLQFVAGELEIPGPWIGDERRFVMFTDLAQGRQRRFLNIPLPFSEGRLPSIKLEEEVFNLVNFGGLQQGETDL